MIPTDDAGKQEGEKVDWDLEQSTMQDIAGCRVEVENLVHQDLVTDMLNATFSEARVYDRRAKPSYGYRAVHLVVEIDRRPVEIQIRTALQHSWASATEKVSDVVDPDIKYGGGPLVLQRMFKTLANSIADFEIVEKKYLTRGGNVQLSEEQIRQIGKDMASIKGELKNTCQQLMIHFEGFRQ